MQWQSKNLNQYLGCLNSVSGQLTTWGHKKKSGELGIASNELTIFILISWNMHYMWVVPNTCFPTLIYPHMPNMDAFQVSEPSPIHAEENQAYPPPTSSKISELDEKLILEREDLQNYGYDSHLKMWT